MKKLHFGTAGIPICTENKTTENGIKKVNELGLDNLEIEFVRSVYMNEESAKKSYETGKKYGVILTCHAPYFINLNSLEKTKIYASINRILHSARMANLAGAFSVTFHPGFYMKTPKEKAYESIKQRIKEIVKKLQDEGNPIRVSPETTGKESQFGDIDELLKIAQEVEQTGICVDFAHLHARSGGKNNTYKEFSETLQKVEKALGKEGLQSMHIHMSGINYTGKGERNHLILKESDMDYKELMKAFKDFNVKGVVVCESPNIEQDALLMKKEYYSLK